MGILKKLKTAFTTTTRTWTYRELAEGIQEFLPQVQLNVNTNCLMVSDSGKDRVAIELNAKGNMVKVTFAEDCPAIPAAQVTLVLEMGVRIPVLIETGHVFTASVVTGGGDAEVL